MAQLNLSVGDLAGNYKKILSAYQQASKSGADLVVFPELAITGYPPEDLILRPYFQTQTIDLMRQLAGNTADSAAILIGSPWIEGSHLFNAAILMDYGKIQHVSCKFDLPNYGVFDEKRVFAVAPIPEPIEFRGIKLGVMICADMWNLEVSKHLKKAGAEILIAINASPFEDGKHNMRINVARQNVESSSLPLIYLNQIAGQDELVFDGDSFILSDKGDVIYTMPKFSESCELTNWTKHGKKWQCEPGEVTIGCDRSESIYSALKLGIYDYIEKNGFPGVVIGMSGGIDSALSAAIAVDALGKKRVRLIMMPSKYTSNASMKDAKECADMLGVELEIISIEGIVDAFTKTMQPSFLRKEQDITEENIQSRIRGSILMAISNKFGHMVLTTGNKSEMAVGYATLYGDMCGGYNVLKDIYKSDVFALCRWRNLQNVVIPENIIIKAPSAELRPDQTDQDTLPPYEILDKILHRLIELRQSSDDIAHAAGIDLETVKRVARMVKISEYKRRQAAPGVKISPLAFGRDRRYPITNAFNL